MKIDARRISRAISLLERLKDGTPNEFVNLQCGKDAEKLAVVDTDSAVAIGIAVQQPGEPVKASASGF